MKVSAVIPTMNRPVDLEKALDSIARQTRRIDEVIIVDQSTNNFSKIAVSEVKTRHGAACPEILYVTQEEKSLVKARNNGLGRATGDIVSFLDDDIVLDPDFFEHVVAKFERDPSVGGIAGNTRVKEKPEGWKWALRKGLMRLFLLSGFDGRITSSGFGYPIYEREIVRQTEVDVLPGCNMTFRRAAIQGEKFDEWFSGYSFREDVDFTYRVSRHARLVMIPEAKLDHNYSTGNRLDAGALKKMEIRNHHHFFQKHRRGAFAKMLFAYSLAGLLVIDFMEFVTSGEPAKLKKFRAGLGSSFSLVTGRIAR